MKRGALSLVLLLGGVNAACMDIGRLPRRHCPETRCRAPRPPRCGRRGPAAGFTGRVVLHDGKLYGAGVDRKVYAVDLATGAGALVAAGSSGLVAGGVLVSGDTVFAASSRPEGRVYALDRGTGRATLAGPRPDRSARHWRSWPETCWSRPASGGAPGHSIRRMGRSVGAASGHGPDRAGGGRGGRRRGGDGGLDLPGEPRDGVGHHRVRSPGTIVSPWVSDAWSPRRRHHRFAGGRARSGRPHVRAGVSGGRARCSARPRRWATPSTSRAGGAPSTVSAPGDAAEGRAVVELDWPVTAPVTHRGRSDPAGRRRRDGACASPRRHRGVAGAALASGRASVRVALDDGILAIGGNGDLHRYRP